MKTIRIGIFGVGVRGIHIGRDAMLAGAEVVAACDFREERLQQAVKEFGSDVALYRTFDEFIEHEMDAVVLANFFHEHAPYAIRCFEKGLHVYSECISNGTMAEGVELVRAFEKSDSIYYLAENYPQMKFNREMKRVCDTGTLGKILYAEGEYNHPGNPFNVEFKKDYNYFEKHWRNFLPRTYYVTHSLGPIMRATGATPRRVTAMAAFAPITDENAPTASYGGDRAAVIMTQNDDGSVFRFTGCAAFGAHHNAYRICGTKGSIENLRGMGEQVMLRYNEWERPEGVRDGLYEPDWNDRDEELIRQTGHGGGDYISVRSFLDCVREGCQPEHPFDLHSAVAMSSVAILGHRSVLSGGQPFDIPDFRDESARVLYENDRETPFYGTDGSEPTISCCSHTDFAPSETQRRAFRDALGIE